MDSAEGTVRANPFDRQWEATHENVLSAVERVGASGFYVLGREVEAFEIEFAKTCGAARAVGCASGLDAIEIGLRALDLQPGDEVLTTPLSAFATTLAIVRAGGVPVFVDVDDSGLLDLDLAEACLSERPEARHLVPVHLFGQALDLQRLSALSQRLGLRIVEDACQAVGARSHGRPVGSAGQIAAFSFYPTKNLGALGDGGCLITADPELAETARCLRDYGQRSKYVHDRLGLNSRLDELHAAILRSAHLPLLSGWTKRRAEIAARYRTGLITDLVTIPPPPRGSTSAWHLFPVLVDDGGRDALLAHLKQGGVQAGIHYPNLIPDQPALTSTPHRVFGELTTARRFASDEVSLPIQPYLSDGEIDRAIDLVNAWRP